MSSFKELFGKKLEVDETVDGLFKASGAGALERPVIVSRTVIESKQEDNDESEEDSEEDESEESEDESEVEEPKRKKSKQDENYDLEAKYFDKLLKSEKKEQTNDETEEQSEKQVDEEAEEQAEEEGDSDSSSDTESETETKAAAPAKATTIDLKEAELQKAERTVFVGNVSNSVVTSKSSYKLFKKLFSKYGKVESIRFRSISFDEPVPRKVAFKRKSLHSSRDTINAYVVFQDKQASTKSTQLNATIFDHNHLRVDHITHPMPKDNKRTIFVGNLDFEAQEETLWRYFMSKTNNDVESVRIVRDSKTNLGKGFALVQFKDTLSVNKCLLLNDKPIDSKSKRKLRISRAKNFTKPSQLSPNFEKPAKKPRHKSLTDGQKTKLGRAQTVLGKADRATVGKKIIEGQRAKKGESIKGIKGLKSDRDRKVKKPRIRERSTKFKMERKQIQKAAK